MVLEFEFDRASIVEVFGSFRDLIPVEFRKFWIFLNEINKNLYLSEFWGSLMTYNLFWLVTSYNLNGGSSSFFILQGAHVII